MKSYSCRLASFSYTGPSHWLQNHFNHIFTYPVWWGCLQCHCKSCVPYYLFARSHLLSCLVLSCFLLFCHVLSCHILFSILLGIVIYFRFLGCLCLGLSCAVICDIVIWYCLCHSLSFICLENMPLYVMYLLNGFSSKEFVGEAPQSKGVSIP